MAIDNFSQQTAVEVNFHIPHKPKSKFSCWLYCILDNFLQSINVRTLQTNVQELIDKYLCEHDSKPLLHLVFTQ